MNIDPDWPEWVVRQGFTCVWVKAPSGTEAVETAAKRLRHMGGWKVGPDADHEVFAAVEYRKHAQPGDYTRSLIVASGTRRDIRPQLPRHRDHGVPSKRRRPRGRGPDRRARVHPHHPALQPPEGRDLARRNRAHSHLSALALGGVTHTLQSPENPGRFTVERYTRNFKRWRGGEMIQRWVSAALLDAERRFRRVRGFRDMPRLMLALDDHSTHFKQPEIAAWNPKSRRSPPTSSTTLGTTSTGKNRISVNSLLITYQAHLARSPAWIAPWGACNGRRIGPNGLHDAMSVARIRFPCRCGAWNMRFVRNQEFSCIEDPYRRALNRGLLRSGNGFRPTLTLGCAPFKAYAIGATPGGANCPHFFDRLGCSKILTMRRTRHVIAL